MGAEDRDPQEQSRVAEIDVLKARVSDVNERLKRSERDMPQPPYRTRSGRRQFDRWLSKREEFLEKYQAAHGRLANLLLPQRPRSSEDPLTLFDAHLLVPFEDIPTGARMVRLFFNNPQETGRILRNSLLYERIYIPTVDLMAVPLLLAMIGPENLIEAFGNGDIVLVRYRGAVGYVGNGNGLELFELSSTEDRRFRGETDRNWGPTDEVLRNLGDQFAPPGDLLSPYWNDISRALLEHVVEIDSAEFEPVADATYHDVLGNPEIQELFRVPGGSLKELPGVGPAELRWLGLHRLNDEVDVLLHLGQFNFETYMADKVGTLDQTSGPGARHLLLARASRWIGA